MNNEVKTCEVFLWGTRIGFVYLNDINDICSFEYDKDFIKMQIEISPIKMPLSNVVYSFPDLDKNTFRGLPGLLYDSLPDKFGNAVIKNWLTSVGREVDTFNVIERLCYTGKRGMGALEYEPMIEQTKDKSNNIDISSLAILADEILDEKKNIKISYDNINEMELLKLGTSAGGARAKAIIAINEKAGMIKSGQIDAGEGYEYYIVKFDGIKENGDHNEKDVKEYTKIEYCYYLMAKECNIDMTKCMLYKDGEKNHFMTKRFDRMVKNGKMEKLHMQTLSALTHIDYNVPLLCSYESLAKYSKMLNIDYEDIEQIYKRMAFNVIGVNCDDHVKNFSFLMERNGQWKLAPAYDMTFAYKKGNKWLSKHQMSINNKSENITIEDMIECGKNMELSERKSRQIIEKTIEVFDNFDNYARDVSIKEDTKKMINDVIKENLKYTKRFV